jgi:hypothetical protein
VTLLFDRGRFAGPTPCPAEAGRTGARIAMPTLRLTYDEFRQVARLCQAFDIRHLPSGFDFKRYLLQLLVAQSPSTATLVEGLTAEETALLQAEVAEYQALGR